jgi:hypothetical protein
MCDFCGCPTIPPFDRLTDDHLTLTAVAEAYEQSRDALDLEALRITWADHVAAERPAVAYLAKELDLEDLLEIGRELDARVEAALATGGAAEIVRAVADHAEGYEFEIYSALVLQAADEDLAEAARCAAGAEAAA